LEKSDIIKGLVERWKKKYTGQRKEYGMISAA